MHPLVSLAKEAVENYVKKGEIISPPEDLPGEFLARKAGTFVTIEKEIRDLPRSQAKLGLRGCIGTYLPTRPNIAEEIIHNAISAATEDYRFGPIREEELSSLKYTVYILSEPELVYPVKSREAGALLSAEQLNRVKDLKELDPKKYGIIVKTGPFTYPNQENVIFNGVIPYKTGLLLPDLEGVDTIEKQIAIACQKGGIDPTKEKIFIYKFTVEKYQ